MRLDVSQPLTLGCNRALYVILNAHLFAQQPDLLVQLILLCRQVSAVVRNCRAPRLGDVVANAWPMTGLLPGGLHAPARFFGILRRNSRKGEVMLASRTCRPAACQMSRVTQLAVAIGTASMEGPLSLGLSERPPQETSRGRYEAPQRPKGVLEAHSILGWRVAVLKHSIQV